MKLNMQDMRGASLTVNTGWSRAHIKGKVGDNYRKTGQAVFWRTLDLNLYGKHDIWRETLAMGQESQPSF